MLKRLRLPLALAVTLLALTGLRAAEPATASADVPELPPRVVSPTDKAEFRRLVLDNGIRVLLVSDPNFNKSAASLVVGIGGNDDPFEHAGLAHFLEHMLFLGTEKYPDVSAYSGFITANGGYNNAYTASDHTNYQFEVRHEAFPEALDRFAQFFIGPLFAPEYTGREVNAVHNEAMRHVQSDLRRMLNVRRELYAPEAGESKFSTGNKTTLANANADVVREFYHNQYSAERMALALAGTASLDELEKLAREDFSAIPRRDLPVIPREPIFLPKKAALRLATIEPVKEIRELYLEFPIPPTRPDFASKPDQLLIALLDYAGPGGLVQALKDADLATKVGSFTWERTPGYGSLFVAADLTPHGQENLNTVMATVFAYVQHLRDAPFPSAFYADQARIAALQETYEDRGEGADLAADLANNALFYPLAVAERAPHVWGAPDEAAYRKLLARLTPDNMLATFAAKGVPTDQTEEIYGTAYAYTETTGEAYDRLVNPTTDASFKLPAPNPFMPSEVKLIAERPLPLIDEPGLHLYYAPDVEFQRPQATLKFRFVPTRAIATAETDLLRRYYEACLADALEPAAGDAAIAGVSYSINVGLEGFDLTVSGFGDSPARFARYVAEQLLTFDVTPARFASLAESVGRELRSYKQTEAYRLAGDRSTALLREFYFLPDASLDQTEQVTWEKVRAFAQNYFATGKVEALVHGHLTPDQAVAATRAVTSAIGAKPAPADALLRRRVLTPAAGQPLLDIATIEGVNSAYRANYLLPDDSPTTRAAGQVIANFINEPFYTELRTKQQLGYIVGSNVVNSLHQNILLLVVQSSGYAADELRQRAETQLDALPAALAAVSDEEWTTLIAGVRAQLEEKPKSIAEKADRLFALGYDYEGEWDRRQATLAALDALTPADTAALFARVIDREAAAAAIVLLDSPEHTASTARPSFDDRETWKKKQNYR